MSDSISIYLQEIGKTPLLNAADERTLSKAIEAGRAADARIAAGEKSVALRREARAGAEAKERFIKANLRLVVSIARRSEEGDGVSVAARLRRSPKGGGHERNQARQPRHFHEKMGS